MSSHNASVILQTIKNFIGIYIMRYLFIAFILSIFSLSACEGKKSLDGHPMDKPPPSADAPRDSEPNFDDLDDPTPDQPKKW